MPDARPKSNKPTQTNKERRSNHQIREQSKGDKV